MNTMKEYSKFNKINVDHYSRWLPFFTGNHLIDTVANDTPVELFGDFKVLNFYASAHAIVGYYVQMALTAIGDVILVGIEWKIMIIVTYM